MDPVTVHATPEDRLEMSAEFPDATPEVVFDHFASPEMVTTWWPQEAEIEPREGGAYHFAWPTRTWHLRGRFTRFVRGKALAFTWAWDHLRGEPATVGVTFEPHGERGTRVTIRQGPYPNGHGTRAEHLDGWRDALGRLAARLRAS